jgi:predicted CXXCH cytochrome family protein
MKFVKWTISMVLFLGVVLVAWVVSPAGWVLAQESANEACLACHGQPGLQTTLPSGEVLYLTVDREVYNASVHGQQGMLCIHCHADASEYPHAPLTVNTRRDLSLSYYRSSCILCHRDKYDATLDSVHQIALAGGDTRAAICTDCHGTHNIMPAEGPRSRASQMCARCHSEIFERYKNSVHGAALIGEGNPDVPGCTDCHQVHRIEGPLTGAFHLFSPQICAKCHADPEMMGRYGISTDVFDTYVADFHGTTVILFQAVAPDQETNKPVCIDCHGVHDMKQVDDPESAVMKENLLSTCQKCHPDATANFPTSWISHYRPDPRHASLVYYIRLFYEIFIPILIVGMILFVASDARKRLVDRKNKER